MADSNIVDIKARLQRRLDEQAKVFDEMDCAYQCLEILARAIGEMRLLGADQRMIVGQLRITISELEKAGP